MTFTESVQTCLTKYMNFDGRASRSEFWWFALLCMILNIAITMSKSQTLMIMALSIVPPILAATARRLHDTNRSGWWQLINFVPFIGGLVLIYFLAQESVEPNQYSTVQPPPPVT